MRATRIVAIGALLLASPAWADHTSLHATASGEVAATDNLIGTGSDGLGQADMFFTVRPGLLYAYDAPQMIHDFSVEAEVLEYVLHNQQPLVTGMAGWKSLFFTGPRSQLTMSINAATGLLSALASRTTSDQTTITVMPSGQVNVQQADSEESLSWTASKEVRVTQGLYGRYGFTDDGAGTTTDTREVGSSLGIERTFSRDTLGLTGSVAYLQLERIAPIGAMLGSRLDHQLNPRATALWRHDINRLWSASADGGVVFVNPVGIDKYNPMKVRRDGTFGVFGAQLAYTDSWGRAVVAARRDVAPNLFLAENTIDDTANVQVALPLAWLDVTKHNPKFALLASAGVEHTQLIDSDSGAPQGDFKAVHLDATLGYTPTPGQTYGLRYEVEYQTGDTVALMEIPAFYRNTLYVTFSLRYPDRVPGELPRHMQSLRSDRKDMPSTDPQVIDILNDRRDDDTSSGSNN